MRISTRAADVLIDAADEIDRFKAEIDRLRTQRDKLLEACEDESSQNMRELEAYRRWLVDGARFAAIDFRRLIEEEFGNFRKLGRPSRPS